MVKHRRIQEARAKMMFQLWRCGACGEKVYYGRANSPSASCSCGAKCWEKANADEIKK